MDGKYRLSTGSKHFLSHMLQHDIYIKTFDRKTFQRKFMIICYLDFYAFHHILKNHQSATTETDIPSISNLITYNDYFPNSQGFHSKLIKEKHYVLISIFLEYFNN